MKRESIRLFKSDFCEWFSHVHPMTPLTVWLPVVAWLFYRSVYLYDLSGYELTTLVLSGLFTWTFGEYVLHRFLFHFKTENPFIKRSIFLMHGIHHADPEDATRLVMTPWVSIPFGIIFYTSFHLLLGPAYGGAFFASFVVGYLAYDYIHYWVHFYRPKSRFGKMLKENHMLHHFVEHEAKWGVSSPLWDYVFDTMKPKAKAASQSEASSIPRKTTAT